MPANSRTTAGNVERSIFMVGSLIGSSKAGSGSLAAGGDGAAILQVGSDSPLLYSRSGNLFPANLGEWHALRYSEGRATRAEHLLLAEQLVDGPLHGVGPDLVAFLAQVQGVG